MTYKILILLTFIVLIYCSLSLHTDNPPGLWLLPRLGYTRQPVGIQMNCKELHREGCPFAITPAALSGLQPYQISGPHRRPRHQNSGSCCRRRRQGSDDQDRPHQSGCGACRQREGERITQKQEGGHWPPSCFKQHH